VFGSAVVTGGNRGEDGEEGVEGDGREVVLERGREENKVKG
jgi:hypothetical protein